MTLFHATGAYIYFDPDGAPVGMEDVFSKIDKPRRHYEAIGRADYGRALPALTIEFSSAALGWLAGLYGLEDQERRALWLARLGVDRFALELMREAPLPRDQGVVDVHSLVLRKSRSRAEDPAERPATGIAQVALDVRDGRESVVGRVERALARAKETAHLHALTKLSRTRW